MQEQKQLSITQEEENIASGLAIILRPAALCFALFNDRDEVLDFVLTAFSDSKLPILENCHQILKSDERLQRKFQNVRIGLPGRGVFLIPSRLFDKQNLSDYGNFLLPNNPDTTCVSDAVSDLDFTIGYSVHKALTACFNSYFTNARYYNISTGLILAAKHFSAPNSGSRVYLHIQSMELCLLAFENRQLMQIIHQPISDESDLAYFLMLMYNQMEYNPEQVPVYLMGEIEKNSMLYNAVYRYVRHVHFVPGPSWVSFAGEQPTIQTQHHYDLFSLLLCA